MEDESLKQPVPAPPKTLPARCARRFRSHDEEEFAVSVKVVTPILGGSFFTGGDGIAYREYDAIRVPTVRGHLRFWWRALQPPNLDGRTLRERERSLWGGMGAAGEGDQGKQPKASRVSVRVESVTPATSEIDTDEPPEGGRGYALFPARQQKKHGQVLRDTVPRLKAGISFTLRISCPPDRVEEVRGAVRAWILFGGYGSRTRRGLGSLTVSEDVATWLPTTANAEMVTRLLVGEGSVSDTPTLAGSALTSGTSTTDADSAWDQAVGQLQYFRQQRGFARERGTQRPGQSRWPEPDKIRHLSRKTQGHAPRFNDRPAWPRAQFGLPIVGRFNGRDEPGDFQIQWQPEGAVKPSDRLASPLIVKPLSLADGKFVPCALWLSRGFPAGKAVLVMDNRVVPNSAAAFESMHGTGDTILHPALHGQSSVRQAFFDWLVNDCRWQRVSG